MPLKLLVVDEAAPFRQRLVSAIGDIKGIEVVGKARHAGVAVEEVLRLQPDVVILDVRLPGGSGIWVLERIKEEAPATIVIIFTSCDFAQYRDRCTGAGADFFFAKQTDVRKLLRELTQLAGCLPEHRL